jgi:hypothetical protein
LTLPPADPEAARMHRRDWRPQGRIHPLAWLFIGLAIADVIWYVVNASFGPTTGAADRLAYAIQVVPSVAVFLMPAVLLIRHPEAMWRARTLVLGLFLVAISQALLIVSTPLQPVFAALTPASAELPIIWSSALFDDLTSLIFAFGLAYVALGLSQVRQYEGRSRSLTALFVTVLAILGTVVGAYYYLRIVKVMYMDEPVASYARVREPIQGLLILLAAIAVSPLGYLLIGPLGALTDRAAGSIF